MPRPWARAGGGAFPAALNSRALQRRVWTAGPETQPNEFRPPAVAHRLLPLTKSRHPEF